MFTSPCRLLSAIARSSCGQYNSETSQTRLCITQTIPGTNETVKNTAPDCDILMLPEKKTCKKGYTLARAQKKYKNSSQKEASTIFNPLENESLHGCAAGGDRLLF